MRVVIVGAGVAGLSAARALVERGVRPIVVAPDHGMTALGAGIVSAQFRDPALLALARRGREIVRRSVRVRGRGHAQIATSDEGARRLDGLVDVLDALPRDLAAALTPGFRRRIVRAVFGPQDVWVAPADVLRAFGRGSRRVRARVVSVADGVVTTTSGVIEADRVLFATGTWAERLAPGLEMSTSHAAVARTRTSVPAMLHVVETGFYARPDSDGRALVGDGSLVGIRRGAAGVFGAHARCVGAGCGAIATSADGRPILRRLDETTYVLAALGGDGLALGPALGEDAAEMMLDGGAPVRAVRRSSRTGPAPSATSRRA